MALDFKGKKELPHPLATSYFALIDPVAGSRNAIAESLSNLFGHH
jgi:hypothetical protein